MKGFLILVGQIVLVLALRFVLEQMAEKKQLLQKLIGFGSDSVCFLLLIRFTEEYIVRIFRTLLRFF